MEDSSSTMTMRNAPPSRGSVSARVSRIPAGLSPRPEASRVQPCVEEIFCRGGDLPPDGYKVFVRHDGLSALSRPVTKTSSEASLVRRSVRARAHHVRVPKPPAAIGAVEP